VAILAIVGALLLIRRGRWLITMLLGAAVGGLGLALALTAPPTASFGWFAYVPLSQSVFIPTSMGGQQFAGVILAATGLLVIGLGAGAWLLSGRVSRADH